MARSAFKQRDVNRAIAAAKRAGLPIEKIKIDPRTGEIELVLGETKPDDATPPDDWQDAIQELKDKRGV